MTSTYGRAWVGACERCGWQRTRARVTDPTDVLKLITFGTDFAVLPLEHSASEKIYAALGGRIPKKILHVQIEKNGVIQFGAYDCFHRECIAF